MANYCEGTARILGSPKILNNLEKCLDNLEELVGRFNVDGDSDWMGGLFGDESATSEVKYPLDGFMDMPIECSVFN